MAGSGAGGLWPARAWVAVAAAVLAGLLGWGVYATGLGVSGRVSSSLQVGGSSQVVVDAACQSEPVSVRALYAGALDPASGYVVPLEGFEVAGVDPGCAGMNLVLAVQLAGSGFHELSGAVAVSAGEPSYALSPAGLPAHEPADIAGYSLKLVPTATAPTGLVAEAGDGQGVLTFDAPLPGTSAITAYEYSLDAGASWLPAAQGSSPITVTGLVNGTGYSLTLRAVSAEGPGKASAPAGLTPRIGAPAALAATAGNASASIAFTAPATPSTIANWQYSLDDGPWTALDPADAASPIVIAGLANNVAVQVRIRAVDANGHGLPSAPVAVTPEAADEDLAPAFVLGGGATGL